MVRRFQRWVSRLFDRHGIWLHMALLVVCAYFALVWSMHERWWGERYRVHGKHNAGVRLPQQTLYGNATFDEFEGWKLVGTLISESGERVALLSQKGERRFLRTGQALEGSETWSVVNVESGAVTLSSGPRTQTLVMLGSAQGSFQQPARTVRIDIKRRVAGELFPMLHWNAVPMGGPFVGLRLLTPVARRNASTFGLVEGDTVESVNGLPITADVPERLVERFRNDDSLNLGVRRQGQLLQIHFSLYD